MKFDVVCSIAHNLADSLGSGASSLFQIWDDYVYREALQAPEKKVEIDLLLGEVLTPGTSDTLKHIVSHSPVALADLCKRHQIAPTSFRRLLVNFGASHYGRQFTVIVENEHGKCRSTTYDGISGKKLAPDKHPPVSTAYV